MAVKTPSFGRVLHSWSPLNDKSVGGGDQTNGHDVFRVKLAHMDSSDGDITDNDREDSKDLLIEHRPRNGTGAVYFEYICSTLIALLLIVTSLF